VSNPKVSIASGGVGLGVEYKLSPGTYTVDLTQSEFTAVTAPAGSRVFSPGGYPERKLGAIRSNSIEFKVIP
jgi:hypothetical protein